MKLLAACIAVFSIVGLVYCADSTVPDLTVTNLFTTVVDPCIVNNTDCSLVKLISEAAWDSNPLGIQYISYGDFWKLIGCTCVETTATTGVLTCGLLNVQILNNCPCYGCVVLNS